MAITITGEQHWGREGEQVPSPEHGEGVSAGTYSRMFMLQTTSPLDGPREIMAAVAVQLGDAYPSDNASICVRKRAANLREHWKIWNVFCDYRRPPTQILQYTYGSERSEVVPFAGNRSLNPGSQNEVFDRSKGIVTSAGEEFDPPPTVPKFRGTITITAYVDTFDPAKQKKFLGAINSPAITINGVAYGEKTLMCTRYEAQRVTTGELARKWIVTVTLLIDEEEHKLRLFDYGTKYFKTQQDKDQNLVSVFRGKDDGPIKKRLDGNGFEQTNNAAADSFMVYSVFPEQNFSTLI